MDFLLVVIMFTMDPSTQQIDDTIVATKPFETLAECNDTGRNIRVEMDLPEDLHSVSYCVRKDDIDK